jgi:hypothetical protein
MRIIAGRIGEQVAKIAVSRTEKQVVNNTGEQNTMNALSIKKNCLTT